MNSIAAHNIVLADAATRGARYEGPIDAALMPRLTALIAQSKADAVGAQRAPIEAVGFADIEFSEHRKPRFIGVRGKIEFECGLVCQRCLELASVSVSRTLNLAVCQTSAEDDYLAPVAERFERWDHDEESLLLAGLFEELILLELPLVVMHKDVADCGALASDERFASRQVNTQTPFADLAAMLGSKDNG
ncbi:MAG: YceD family protein [Pseudomonadota bacterium]